MELNEYQRKAKTPRVERLFVVEVAEEIRIK